MYRVPTLASRVILVVTVVGLLPAHARAQTGSVGLVPDNAIQSALGKTVRVKVVKGAGRKGKLVSLSASEVVITQQGRNVSLPLGEVRKVEKVSHGVRNGALAGLPIGAALGVMAGPACSRSGECELWVSVVAGAAYGAGIGAAVGAVADYFKADGNILYRSPTTTSTVTFSPVVIPRGIALAAAVRW